MKIFCRLFVLVLGVSATAEPADEWYVLLNGADRLGYLHASTEEADGRIISHQTMKLAVGRAGATIEISVESSFVETADGAPVEARSVLNMGGTPLTGHAVFTDSAIQYTVRQGGGAPSTVNKPLPEPGWLPPAALERYVAKRLEAGDQEISVRTMDIAGGPQVVTMTMRVAGEEDIEVYGRTVPAVVWDAEVSMMPGVAMREYVGHDGRRLKTTVELMPGLSLTVLLADRDLALSPLTPTEMIASTLVTPDRPIERPRALRRARYEMRSIDGRPVRLPDLSSQRIVGWGEGSVTIEVDLDRDPLVAAPVPGAALRTASPMLDHSDPDVKRLGQRWAAAAIDTDGDGVVGDAETAEALRAGVHAFIRKKDLSVGFASAGDVARTAQGDCTEHAVLLAAVLRGAGVPARCVSGLVYADQFAGHAGVFGYHMWTQAFLDPDGAGPRPEQWTDLDATLPGVAYDATHITLGVTDLNEGVMGNDMAALLPVLGNLQIQVLEAAHGAPPPRPGGGDPAAP